MKEITNINTAPKQEITFQLDDGTTFNMIISFIDLQLGWFIDELTYGDSFTLRSVRICNNPNLLHQFKNLIPFGLACYSDSKREPMLQIDFEQRNNYLLVLNSSEVSELDGILSNG